MTNQFYEERIPIPGFSLTYSKSLKAVYNVQQNIQVDGQNKSLLFLHIKSFDVSNMKMPFILANNVEKPRLCFIVIHKDVATNEIVSQFTHIRDTTIFTESSYTTSLDRFIELINRCINYYVKDVKDGVDCRLLYGNFTIEENTLQYKYLNEQHGNIPNKIAVLGFNSVFVDIILKYFDIHYVKEDPFEFYYI